VYLIALYDYEAGGDGELSFVEGDPIFVIEEDPSGWSRASNLDRKIGYVPGNYIERIQ